MVLEDLPWSGFYSKISPRHALGRVFMKMNIKNEFYFLFPAPKTICWQNPVLDIQNLCFPLEITKKYDFLFDYFSVKNKNRGLEIVCQEKKTLSSEEYIIESDQSRIVLWANSQRGQFYALSTLLQILAFYKKSGCMPGFFIKDAPDISFRGFLLDVAHGAFPLLPELQRLLLKLALLKFNHFSMYLGGPTNPENAARGDSQEGNIALNEIDLIAALAGKMGMDMFPAITIGPDVHSLDNAVCTGNFNAEIIASFRSKLIHIVLSEKTETEPAAVWFERFLDTYRFFKAQGKMILVWGDVFLATPDLIRKIPQDVLVLNRDYTIEKTDAFKKKAGIFKKHHIPQALCTATWSRARFIPAMRRSMVNNAAAFAAAKDEKLAGVMLTSCAEKGDGSFLEGIILPLFQAGNLFWSGQSPRPDAFTQWALGHNEPDLFRVYTFLSQVDSPLQHTHRQYLFEDPLFAAFSRQDNAKEIVARYRKTSLYLKKRKIARNEMSDFLNFAQHLYEFVADKVEFSSRLLSCLSAADGDEKIRQGLDRLLRGNEKLKNLFCELWLKRRKPYGLAKKIKEFDFLQERCNYLLQSIAYPAAKKNLIFKLKNYVPDQFQPGANANDIFEQ
jgi:hypothetical protein